MSHLQAKDAVQFQIRQNRLRRPRCPVDVIPRPRLLQLLDAPARLTVVVAPAGYGKTTLICNWLDSRRQPAAWVTLASDDSGLREFLMQTLLAVQIVLPSFGDGLLERFESNTLPPIAVIAEMLYQAFADAGQDLVLVLDDYHLLGDSEVHALLTALLSLHPLHLHLVITARHDPPLPLLSLRLHDRIVEIRGTDLRFSEKETLRLFEGQWAEPLSKTEINELVRGTDGWVMALRLAKLFFLQEQGFASLGKALDAGSYHAVEFLSEEVFVRLPQQVQVFLMRTAVLEQLCPGVCAAVGEVSEHDARAILRWLEDHGIFTVAMDEAHVWFEYHTLFRRLIKQQMGNAFTPQQIGEFHHLASTWYLNNGYTDDAIRHALMAGERGAALKIFAQVRPAIMNMQGWLRLANLIRLFPEEIRAREPELLIAEMWIARIQNDTKAVRANLAGAEAALLLQREQLSTPDREGREALAQLQGELEALKMFVCYWSMDATATIRHGLNCLALIPQEDTFVRIFVVIFLSLAHHMQGDLQAAYRVVDEYARSVWMLGPVYQMHVLTARGFVESIAADLPALRTTVEQMIALVRELPWTEESAIAYALRLQVDYAQNDLPAVVAQAHDFVERRYQISPRQYTQCAYLLAMAYHALGRHNEAHQIADSAVVYVNELNAVGYVPMVSGLQAELALREGRVEDADLHLRGMDSTPMISTANIYEPRMTLARLYLRQNTVDSLQAAADLLARLETMLEATHRTQFLSETLALKALYLQRCEKLADACVCLDRAIRLAEPGGNLRVFVNLGEELLSLLEYAQRKEVAPLFTAAIRTAILSESAALPAKRPPVQDDRPVQDNLAVVLTFREQEVLTLLGEHLTNQEIAGILNISPETVKRHCLSIYRKLNVKNRRAAAVLAKDLAD